MKKFDHWVRNLRGWKRVGVTLALVPVSVVIAPVAAPICEILANQENDPE